MGAARRTLPGWQSTVTRLVNQRCASPSIAILRGSAEYRCSAYGRFQMPPGVEVFTDHDDEYLE